MRARRLWIGAGVVLAGLIYAFLANDGRHHWHEFRDLYSATFYSTGQTGQIIVVVGTTAVLEHY